MIEIRTDRLLLRQWRQDDLAPFAALNADPEVMRYFPALLSREESDGMAHRCGDLIEARGWGFWAVQEQATGAFIGFIGLHTPAPELPCSPCVEVGWRLLKSSWGKGLATEGAAASLRYAFDTLKLAEVVSFTSVHNLRSEAVMQRLGMQRDPSTFAHPSLPRGHWLSEHCLYRLTSRNKHEARLPPTHSHHPLS
ncbi:GNAT family N-acetyltransferase [Hydrogenophaga sp.]|uniref:GNAT family N-acetyltransferase n=1 Tax=Hydrogenophaga sp. TaxID=1904254 RepID=UPI002718C0D7|nr:GNAT family N-acetyltransferase [Hydrogenophaga sp.]MDO9435224.1 GNAT family N-acetyltransferase [Hydrogenophaga sp.]